jgi:hypothetical protein
LRALDAIQGTERSYLKESSYAKVYRISTSLSTAGNCLERGPVDANVLAVVARLGLHLRFLGAASVLRCVTLDAHVLSRLQTESG